MTKLVHESEVEWRDFEIPDSNSPVKIGRFWLDRKTFEMTQLVKFPPGWSRLVFGQYESDEEFYVIEGDVQIGDVAYIPGDFGIWKKALVRGATTSSTGAITLAHFGGPPRWLQGGAPLKEPTGVRFRYKEVEPADSTFGVQGRFVGSAWVLEDEGGTAPATADAEVFSPSELTWGWVSAGEPLPDLKTPLIAWLREPRSDERRGVRGE
jgi:hypothetical protein